MARYVLLRIDDGGEADIFLRDLALFPRSPLMSPETECRVHVEIVPGVDASDQRRGRSNTGPMTAVSRDGERAGLLSFVAASYKRAAELAADAEVEL